MSECEHEFAYAGVAYKVDDRPLSGTSARHVNYYRLYYCKKCCQEKIIDLGVHGNSYEPIKFSAFPLGK